MARHIAQFMLLAMLAVYAYWAAFDQSSASHLRALAMEGFVQAAYIPPTGAQPVVPYGTFSVSVQNSVSLSPNPIPVSPQVIPVSPQVIPVSPSVLSVSPQVLSVSPNPIGVSPNPIPVSPQVIPVSPQVIPVSPSVLSVSPNPIPVSPQILPVSPQVLPVSPNPLGVSPNPLPVTPQVLPVSPNPLPVSPQVLPVSPNPIPVSPSVLSVSPVVLSVSPNPLPITANATLPVNAGTPAVQNAYTLGAASTSTATTIPNNYSGATPVLNHLSLGYDNTASSNAYRAIHVDASGNQVVNVNGTPAVQGSVSLNNTPGVAVQNTVGIVAQATVPVSVSTLGVVVQNGNGSPVPISTNSSGQIFNVAPNGTFSVSLQNTPGVLVQGTIGVALQNTPAIQGSVSINNTPAIQGSVSINNTPGVAIQNTVQAVQPTSDPCQNPALLHSFATISFATATTGGENTQRIVSGNGSKQVYVCDCSFDVQATAGSPTYAIKFVQATPTATTGGIQCTAQATVALSGDYMSGVHAIGGGDSTIMNVGAGNSLCVRSLGISNAQGRCSYVQQ